MTKEQQEKLYQLFIAGYLVFYSGNQVTHMLRSYISEETTYTYKYTNDEDYRDLTYMNTHVITIAQPLPFIEHWMDIEL